MKKFTLLSIMLFLYVASFSQIMPDAYDGIEQSSKSRIFIDNLDDNRYYWIKESSPNTHRIADGYLFFANDFGFSFIDGKPINFDPTRNFELETKIKFISGDVEEFNGLFIGQLIFGDKYYYSFSSMGEYKIEKEVSLITEVIVPPTKLSSINQTAENSLTIRKYDDIYYFFINKTLVHTMPYETLPGQYIGFNVSKKTLIRINFLRLQYIN